MLFICGFVSLLRLSSFRQDDRVTKWPSEEWLSDQMTKLSNDQMTGWQEASQTIDRMVYLILHRVCVAAPRLTARSRTDTPTSSQTSGRPPCPPWPRRAGAAVPGRGRGRAPCRGWGAWRPRAWACPPRRPRRWRATRRARWRTRWPGTAPGWTPAPASPPPPRSQQSPAAQTCRRCLTRLRSSFYGFWLYTITHPRQTSAS